MKCTNFGTLTEKGHSVEDPLNFHVLFCGWSSLHLLLDLHNLPSSGLAKAFFVCFFVCTFNNRK